MTDDPRRATPLTLDDYVVQAPERLPWYKRTAFLIAIAVAVIVGASILVDLPGKTTPQADAAAQTTVINQINRDIAGCAYATRESFMIYTSFTKHRLTTSQLHLAPGMLTDDHGACSLTSGTIYDLANIQGTGSAAGKRVLDAAQVSLIWSTSDAVSAIVAIQNALDHKATAHTYASLHKAEQQLRADRSKVVADVAAASKSVHATLPAIKLPSLPALPGA